jgi:hypothetical protein
LASIVRRTEPLPLPLPLVTWTHAASAAAVHAQPLTVATVNVTAPPSADTAALDGEKANLHGAGSCATVISTVLIVIVARRDAGCALASTRYDSAPSPWPLVGGSSATQPAEAEAAHVQSRVVETVICPVPPAAGVVGTAPAVTWQRGRSGAVTDVTDVDPHA